MTRAPAPPSICSYGSDPSHVGELHLPGGDGPAPLVVLVHGGFWRARAGYDGLTPLAVDMASRGWAAWNIEYRRVGQAGGGWPGTFHDVAAAVDHVAALAGEHPIDAARVVLLGHSAGGQLALWGAARHRLAVGAPGAGPAVSPPAVVALAPVCDLVAAAGVGLGGDAVVELLGGAPTEVPDRYAIASPSALLPVGASILLVHGADDDRVPPADSRAFADRARAAGDRVERREVPGADHFTLIDPSSPAWLDTAAWLEAWAA